MCGSCVLSVKLNGHEIDGLHAMDLHEEIKELSDNYEEK